MSERIVMHVPEELDGERIDRWLALTDLRLSRVRVKYLILSGGVRKAETTIQQPSYRIKAGESFEIEVPEPDPIEIKPESIPLNILYEDEYLIALNKPPDLCVHPTIARRTGTLVNGLINYLGKLSTIGGAYRPGIVHRLDQGTSGVIVIAKNDFSHHHLSNQFHDRVTEKKYIAIVDNVPSWNEMVVDKPIGRDLRHRKRMMITKHGKPALTTIKVVARRVNLGVVEAYPKTGRTHQIRVHLRNCTCPVANDNLYRRNPYQGLLEAKVRAYPGILLHALSLSLFHPASGAKITFNAPFPDEFEIIRSWIINPSSTEPPC